MNQNFPHEHISQKHLPFIEYTSTITIRRHALEQMYTRKISEEEIEEIIKSGEIIESYPDDYPFPSYLICGTTVSRLLHVVAAFNEEEDEIIIITSYEPYEERFNSGKIRRKE